MRLERPIVNYTGEDSAFGRLHDSSILALAGTQATLSVLKRLAVDFGSFHDPFGR